MIRSKLSVRILMSNTIYKNQSCPIVETGAVLVVG